MTIHSPSFDTFLPVNETVINRPLIVFQGNVFEKNMAYFAGNAIYVSNTMKMITSDDNYKTCGAGILIDDNKFLGNIGMKKHSGGAVAVRCSITDSSTTTSISTSTDTDAARAAAKDRAIDPDLASRIPLSTPIIPPITAITPSTTGLNG